MRVLSGSRVQPHGAGGIARRQLLCAVVVALLCGAAVRAHEIGTTRVSVLFAGGPDLRRRNRDRCHRARREARGRRAGRIVVGCRTLDPARLQSRARAASTRQFRQRVKIAFDASEVRPAIAYAVAPAIDAASAAVATIRLTGQIPPGARHFTWTYALDVRVLRHDGPQRRHPRTPQPNGWKAARPARRSH